MKRSNAQNMPGVASLALPVEMENISVTIQPQGGESVTSLVPLSVWRVLMTDAEEQNMHLSEYLAKEFIGIARSAAENGVGHVRLLDALEKAEENFKPLLFVRKPAAQ